MAVQFERPLSVSLSAVLNRTFLSNQSCWFLFSYLCVRGVHA